MLKVDLVNFAALEEAVLAVLAHEFQNSAVEYVSLATLMSRFPQYSQNAIREVLYKIVRGGSGRRMQEVRKSGKSPFSLFDQEQTEFIDHDAWRITQAGFNEVAKWDARRQQEVSSRITWTASIDVDSLDLAVQSPDVDEWAPLPIDRQNPKFEAAMGAVEDAIDTISADNGYAVSAPEERTSILASLKGSVEAIKAGMPSLASIRAGLLAPLRFISEKFVGTAMGETAKKAFELFWDLFVGPK